MDDLPALTDLQRRRSSTFERKMTLRRSNSGFHKPSEITFINYSILYNMILRSVQNKTKSNFIIYDFTPADSKYSFKGENVIKISDYPEIVEQLLKEPEHIKLIEIQKLLPKPKEDLFSKRMRYYNFIILNDSNDTQFFKLFDNKVKSFSQEDSDGKTALLDEGVQRVNEKIFSVLIESSFLEDPELQHSPEAKAWKMAINFQNAMKNNKIKEIQFYKDDCQTFFKKYPFMSKYIETLNHSTTLFYPNEVFFGRFYYGNWKHASNEDIIKQTKVTHILNMTKEVDNYFENHHSLDIKYLKVSIEDLDDVNINEHFEKGYRFLTEALQNPNSKVLVHCAQGKSRSATLVCVFFMRMYQWTYEQTIRYVSDRREIASPNPGFIEQLRQFEMGGFIFDGENIFKRRLSYIITDEIDNSATIDEQEEDKSSSQESSDYFEEGNKKDLQCQQVLQLYNDYNQIENSPENNFIKINSDEALKQNIIKQEQIMLLVENNLGSNMHLNQIEIK